MRPVAVPTVAMAREASCPQSGCGFEIRSNDESEVRDMIERHATDVHDMSLSSNDVSDLIKTV
jgi:predicted small metal-binding protein